MPSAGTRRTTRVFGGVKVGDGARVLRSGRRLWPESGDARFRRANDGDEWLHTMFKSATNKTNHNDSSFKYKEHGWTHDSKLKQGAPAFDIQTPRRVKPENLKDIDKKMFGVVYSRKRKKMGVERHDDYGNKLFGIQFSRRQRRKQGDGDSFSGSERALLIVVEGSCSGGLTPFLNLVFGYIRRTSLKFSELNSFLSTEPVSSAFASSGINFFQDTTANRTGICKIFGVRRTVPVFSLDFSAVPFCFVYMHLSLLLRVKCLYLAPVNTLLEDDLCDEEMIESEDDSCGAVKAETVPETGNSGNRMVLHPSVRASRLAGRNNQYRNGLNSRGIQRRRTSLRRRRARNPSLVGGHKNNGALVSDLISSRENGIPFSSVVSRRKRRSSLQSTAAANLNEAIPSVIVATQAMDLSCSANVLVMESDRCYRIEGATVTLEISDSKEWLLVVKKGGLTRYTHLAQKCMRPCSFNRITHDIIWTGDDSWKLEFTDRQDWLRFKDLYKESSDRNVPTPVSKAIPVPGVYEVFGYEESNSMPYSRPDAYISINNDELARALARRTAIYDMDSEDEEWLKKFNTELFAQSEHQEHISEDTFELMIDAFEKGFFCSPDDFGNGKVAKNMFIDLGRREVVEAVYGYWMKKRKQRRSALLRVFQGQQAKKPPLIPKPVLRKRRSFKRQVSQFGRGKQPTLMQAIADEHDNLVDHNAMRKVEAARTSAKRSMESAILKRRRAQILMENADLAIYKATMSLRIAEGAHVANSTDVAVQLFFD